MAVNFLTLRSAVANDLAVQHLTYSTMAGHPIASHQTVQAITASSIMTMGHVGIGATTAVSGTALNVVGSTMISGNVSIVGGATGDPLRVNNNKTGNDNNVSLILRNNMTPIPSQLGFILKTASAGIYHTLVQTGDHLLLSFDQNNGVAGANGIVIGGRSQTAGLRIGTTSSAFNGDLTINNGNITINNGVSGTLTKIGSTTGYYATFTGGTADNSPFLEFWAGGSRRCYIGNANTTEVQFASENGAQLKFLTGGTSRLTINTTGDITASNPITAPSFVVNGGGSWVPGVIYSDANHGMLFRAKVPGSANIFLWNNSAGSEVLKMLSNGSMNHLMGDNSYMKYGPNSQWNSNLIVGATPDRAGAGTAQVITTNGNLHLDAGNSNDIYYGLYASQRGTPNAHRFSGQVHISGDATVNSGLTGSEVYTNNWFRVNGTGGGVYWQTYGRGIQAADSAAASYGNVSVYGTGINSWNGYDINGRYTFMANGDTVGVHDKNNSWVWYNVNGTMTIPKALNVTGTLNSYGVPITLTEVPLMTGGDSAARNWGHDAGYYRFPGGFTLQWGRWGSSDGSYNYIRYPLVFTRIFGIQATKNGGGIGAVGTFGITTSTCYIDSNGGYNGKLEVFWFAYGYIA